MWDVQVASDVRAYISRFETEAKEVEARFLKSLSGESQHDDLRKSSKNIRLAPIAK
jgi:hypothetical protein